MGVGIRSWQDKIISGKLQNSDQFTYNEKQCTINLTSLRLRSSLVQEDKL